MPRFERSELLKKFRAMVARGEPIVGAGAGTGLSAKCEEAGGVDLIVIYNSGRYRMAGRGSLAGLMPYGDANAIVVEMAGEVLPVVKNTPVLAGVNGTDPFRDMDIFLDQLKALGFAGVQNFPTVGLIDGTYREVVRHLKRQPAEIPAIVVCAPSCPQEYRDYLAALNLRAFDFLCHPYRRMDLERILRATISKRGLSARGAQDPVRVVQPDLRKAG